MANNESVFIPTNVYEAQIPYELRFMIDLDITGCCWIQVPKSTYSLIGFTAKQSTCELEVDILACDLRNLKLCDEYQTIPQLRILSFDIECVTLTGRRFPTPKTDPVIQISTVLMDHGSANPFFKAVFCLNSCAPLPGATILSFDSEADMLMMWRKFLVEADPDIITGYNCINFDMNYLMNIEGRIQIDMLDVIRREYKLKSYSLNAVSAEFLKEQKEDVHYSMLGELHNGNDETRRRIASYCLKDSVLPLRLMNSLLIIINSVEMARVTGTPLSFLLTRLFYRVNSASCKEFSRGQQIKRGSLDEREKAYEGATVLDPIKGLYKSVNFKNDVVLQKPIATLDFASLYPSIMIAHNLCYSTLIATQDVSLDTALSRCALQNSDVSITPSNSVFVHKNIRQGVLPLIVADLLEARRQVREQLKNEKDETIKMVLTGRQLALKISANSVYGYTGALSTGQLPCIEISTAITAYGREMIDRTKDLIEAKFITQNQYSNDAKVVYGDTDSVMVLFGVDDVKQAIELGKEAANYVSTHFRPPIRLEFEKIFHPFLLMSKKRYAGVKYTSAMVTKPQIECKGIETVRRDFCLLIQQVVDTVLKKLLLEQDEEGAKQYTRDIISDLLQDKVDLSLLVMSKSLGKEDYAQKIAHVQLAKKMKQRGRFLIGNSIIRSILLDPGMAPQIGDRVHFVIVPGVKGQAQYDRAEDPIYILENNLTVDTQYYLETMKGAVSRYYQFTGLTHSQRSQ